MLLPGCARWEATGTTGKVTLVRGCLMESKLNAQGLQLLGLRRGRCESRQLWFLFVSPRMTVTPRGLGTMGWGRVTALRLGAACSGCGPVCS